MDSEDRVTEVDVEAAKILRAAWEASGLTQDEVAAALNVSRRQVIRYLNGERSLRMNRFWPLARLLGLNPAEVVDRAETAAGLRGK